MKYIVGNWKMNLGIRESVALARGILRGSRGYEYLPEIILCPAFTALSEVRKVLARSRAHLGAQNFAMKPVGALTGEISFSMLEDVSCTYVILGHSERRHGLNETNEMIQEKIGLLEKSKLIPILCVGETKDERENGDAHKVIEDQLRSALSNFKKKEILIAYEPVWAIGTGESATVADIIEMHKFIRDIAGEVMVRTPEDLSVLYGGSVTDENAYQLLREPQVGGILVGGASIKLNQFLQIVQAGIEVTEAQQGE